MIKNDELKELVKTVLYSGYVLGEKPLSLFVVGNVGIGKSELLNTFNDNDNVAYFTDVTYMGLIQLLNDKKDVKHIVIPDFLKITMKKQSTSANIISCFNAGIEEGIEKISMMGASYDFKGKRFGLITATTKNSYHQHKKEWESMGLLSRMILISYDYSDTTKDNIFDYIFRRGYLNGTTKTKLAMPFQPQEVNLPLKLAKKLKEPSTTFRSQRQMQTLAMARALMHNRKVVTMKDIKDVVKLRQFMNMEFKKV